MWYAFGGLAGLLYLVLIFTLGLTTLRKGHWVMFILGIFLPLFWLIGAVIPPTARAETMLLARKRRAAGRVSDSRMIRVPDPALARCDRDQARPGAAGGAATVLRGSLHPAVGGDRVSRSVLDRAARDRSRARSSASFYRTTPCATTS